MKGEVFKLVLIDDMGFLSPDQHLTLEQMGLHELVQSFLPLSFWNIKVLKYDGSEQCLVCEVLTYAIGEQDFPAKQLEIAGYLSMIQKIHFRTIDTGGLLRTARLCLPEIKMPALPLPSAIMEEPEPEPVANIEKENPAPVLTLRPKPPEKKMIIEEKIEIPFKNISFKLGGAGFTTKLPGYHKELSFTISNPELREEFEAVKNYFANALKVKKIKVYVRVEMEGNRILSATASSPDINRIDKGLVESVKFEFVKKTTTKRVVTQVDKSLFTMQEYFDNFSDEKLKSNAFYENEQQLLDDLLSISSTKHYKYLRYLSQHHAHHIMKLRFIYKPFSFLFLLEGERHYHLVWETLYTTEATYVWHVDKDLNSLKAGFRKVEEVINLVKVQGKIAYIQSSEDAYRRIFHDYSPLVDGFYKWKAELESCLS
jgi:hypothetical protein